MALVNSSEKTRRINDLLKEQKDYLFPGDVKVLSTRLFNVYEDIQPITKQFGVPGTHASERMICLEGTIPVNYRGAVYNIPITIWIPKQFPRVPPIPRVTPNATMSIKASKYVDTNGTVFLPYLHEWTRGTSDLCDLVQTMGCVFSEEPPVYTKQANPPPHMVMPETQPGYPYPSPPQRTVSPYPDATGMPLPYPAPGPSPPPAPAGLMATAGVTRESDFDRKFQALEREIFQTFEELFQALETRKQDLLSRLSALKSAQDNNTQLDEAIKQLRMVRDNAVNVMTNNLLGEDLDPIKEGFDARIRSKEEIKVSSVNVNLIEFRCSSEQILKGIEETDLIELLPEYVGRENPILKKCSQGDKDGQFYNPKGISIDRNTNEVYVVDQSNNRIQVMSINGDHLRSFTHEYLKAPHGICLSDNEVFVTDQETFLLKFHKSGKFLKKAGSRGNTPGCFSAIKGLCYEEGLVYVCDNSIQRINIFDSELKYLKDFAYGEIKTPSNITIHANSIYILSADKNEVYCYNMDCLLQNTIKLRGQKVPMTSAYFFTMDSRGNFLISNDDPSEIRIFSPNGVLKHSLGRGHLKFLHGIALDNSGSIICVNCGVENDSFQKY